MKKYVSMNNKGLMSRFNNVSKRISSRNYKGFGLHLQLQKKSSSTMLWKMALERDLKEALDFDGVVVVVVVVGF